MAKITDCLRNLIEKNELTPAQAREILDQIEELKKVHGARLSPEMAENRATSETAKRLRIDAEREKKLAALRMQATQRITQNMRNHPKGLVAGALAHINGNVPSTFPNVEGVERTVRGMLHALWADGIETMRPRKFGLDRRRVVQEKVLKELFGEDSGDPVSKAIAKAWSESAEYARLRFNAAGGNIAKRADWGLTQTHSMTKVSKVTKHEWVEFVMPLLDRDKMRHPDTGQPLDDLDLLIALSDIYEQIRTDGLINLEPGKMGKRALANRHLDHRFMVFKHADGWRRYQNRFGSGDMYSNMTHHLDVMASEIARLEVLGPNPDAMVRYMADTVKREAAVRGEQIPGIRLKFLEDSYKVASKKINLPVNDSVASFFSGLRNFLTSMQLGGAFLSAISDLGYGKIARNMNGLPANRVFKNYLKYMNPLDKEGRIMATRLGLIAENATSMALAQQRYLGEVMGPQISRLFADAVLKASLLSPWTQAGRWAFGAEYLSFLGMQVKSGKAWGDLPDPLRRNMAQYGLDETDWNTIKKVEVLEQDGVPFVWPVRLAETEGASKTAQNLHRLILTEMERAVPSVNFATRAVLTQGSQPGSLIGEVARSIAMYKAFPVTVMNVHLLPAIRNVGNDRGRYLAELFIYSTVLGMVAYQAKQIQRGRDPITTDPRTEEGRRLWLAAMMQGGGLGIFGDFMFSDVSRFGKSPSMTFAGPVAGFFDDVMRLTLGNVQQLAFNDETNLGREMVRFAGRYLPGGSLWYARLAFERLVLDQIQMKVDPRSRDSFRAIERRAKKDFGQRYWWRPGRTAPGREPDLEQLTGG